MKFLIVAALLIGTLTAAPYIDTKAVLAQMDKDPFGNAMISLVSLNMAAENPASEIILILDNIIT
jgi:hypothetical protein